MPNFNNGSKAVVLIAAIVMSLSLLAVPAKATTAGGPRINELLCKIYPGIAAEFAAMDASEIDLVDSPLGAGEVAAWQNSPTITLDAYRNLGMYEFDVNNNQTIALSYPNLQSPTYDLNFRHAIAHLVDKPYIISTYVDGYGTQLESPFMPWLRWYDPTMTTHAYNPDMACQILYDYGWRSSPDPNVVTDVHFPATWPAIPGGPNVAGSNLKDVLVNGPHGASDPGLIFYRRADHQPRSLAGNLLMYGDATHKGLESIGIPCDDNNMPKSTCYSKVMCEKNFHIYTGGWAFGRDPDYVCDLYNGAYMDWDTNEFASNYCSINDPAFNEYSEKIKFAQDLTVAETNAHLACQRWGEMCFMFPLWTTAGYMAHKTAWHALNADSYGVSSWWNLYCTNNPSIGVTGGQLRWGFASDINQLNVIYSGNAREWQILDKIYDTLTTFNPLNNIDMPWMANSWTIGTWTNPDTGKTASKISFTLRNSIKWIDPLTGTVNSAVTPEDVIFSFQYVYDHVGVNYPSVADIYYDTITNKLKIEASGNTITFYESIASVWVFHWLGGLPIIPKSVFAPITDPHGFTPGGLPAENVLIGSGPFYYVSYNLGVSALLNSNRNYFKTIVPNKDTDPSTVRLDWGIFKSNVRSGDWTVDVLDLIRVARKFGQVGFPPGSIPEDINKDGKINVIDVILVIMDIDATWP